jgi:hypothetical protein
MSWMIMEPNVSGPSPAVAVSADPSCRVLNTSCQWFCFLIVEDSSVVLALRLCSMVSRWTLAIYSSILRLVVYIIIYYIILHIFLPQRIMYGR